MTEGAEAGICPEEGGDEVKFRGARGLVQLEGVGIRRRTGSLEMLGEDL